MKKFLTIAMIMFANAAGAQTPLECNAQNHGILQCMAGKQCECKLFRTSLIKNEPGGYRWDCGILKARCIDPNKISDQENARPYDGPDSVFIDNNRGNRDFENNEIIDPAVTTTPPAVAVP